VIIIASPTRRYLIVVGNLKTMRTIILISFALGHSITFGQTLNEFEVADRILSDKERLNIEQLIKKKKVFYEDEGYTVSQTCSGEWGGTIKFRNKKTGIEYSCSATCPISVNKIGGDYFVTKSLNHLSGSTGILQISQPDSMDIFQLPPPRGTNGKTEFRYVGDTESKSRKGTTTLIQIGGMLALQSFEYNGQLFQVITDFKKTYVAKVENEKFIFLQLISERDLWVDDSNSVTTEDGHLLITIPDGYLDISGNKITILKSS
jgi:hypothetical protein